MERVEKSAALSAMSLSLLSFLSSFVSLFISTATFLLQFESGGSVGLGEERHEGTGSSLSWLADEGVLEECVMEFRPETVVLEASTVVLEVGTVVLEVGTVVLEVGTVVLEVSTVVVVVVILVVVQVIVMVLLEGT